MGDELVAAIVEEYMPNIKYDAEIQEKRWRECSEASSRRY